MKKIILIVWILLPLLGSSQDLHIGIDISPTWNLKGHRTNSTAWYAENGYGFNGGIAVKYFTSDEAAFQTGLNFEYAAFDSWYNNSLVSSLRFGSLHVPLLLNYKLSFFESWYIYAGGGINYNLMNNYLSLGQKVNVSDNIDRFQPYGAVGLNTLMERSNGYFELGFLARYHFMELWDEVQADLHGYSTHVISIDLLLRYYI